MLFPDTAVKGDNGEFTLGKLMFRHKTSSKYSNEELAVWDNIVVKDNDGNTIFSENFENADTCGFAAGMVRLSLTVRLSLASNSPKLQQAIISMRLTDTSTSLRLSRMANFRGQRRTIAITL